MYIETVPNRNSRPAILLREGWREGAKVKKRTIANLTDGPQAKIDALRMVLSGQKVMALDDPLAVYSGHGPATAIGDERRTNQFLQQSR